VLDYVDLKDKEFTANGEYSPDDFSCDGFGTVTVNVPADVKEKVITANGEYYSADDHCMGYNKVTVNVPTGGGGSPYTVMFFNGEELLQTSQVPYGGNAEYNATAGYPQSDIPGQVFIGWNPNPVNVTSNMNCYAVFKDKTILVDEIADDWAIICANGGVDYPLGSYKSLPFGATIPQAEITAVNPGYTGGDVAITFIGFAMKVAEGEGGTNSSWIWMTLTDNGGGLGFDLEYTSPGLSNMVWNTSYTRNFLNTAFFNHMADIFKNAIKPVTKYSQNSPGNSVPYEVVPEQDLIWIPSVKEMMGTDEGLLYLVSAYGSETQFETNFNKYYTQVPQAIAYFRDNLEMTAEDRDTLLMRNLRTAPLRDRGNNEYNKASIMSNTDAGIKIGGRHLAWEGSTSWFTEAYCTSAPILGFCL